MNDATPKLRQWLDELGYDDCELGPAFEDASLRSYFRLQGRDLSWIAMDASGDRDSCDAFVDIADMLRQAGLSAPEIIERDLARGYMLITDYGRREYLSVLDAGTQDSLYADATDALLRMQLHIDPGPLPDYDAALLSQELELFPEWFLRQLLGIELNARQSQAWQTIRQTLVENALQQPRVFVHRDYHSRNLMQIDSGNPGILDFQGALNGPITYDLVSLLRDCYIALPAARVEQMALDYFRSLRAGGLLEVESERFLRWFDLMGVQRHLKAIGIFSRLKFRDAKPDYLKDIPRTLNYVCEVSAAQQPLAGLRSLIDELHLVERAALEVGA